MKSKHLFVCIFFYTSALCSLAQTEEILMRQRSIFIYNFTQQIRWPESFETFKIGVLGPDKIETEIQRLIQQGRTVQGKRIELIKLSTVESIQNVQLIYTNRKLGFNISQVIQQVSGKGILVISEDYPYNSSMINMVLVDNSFQFEINESRLQNEGFVLSSGLKELAVSSARRWQALYEKSTESLAEEKKKVEAQEALIAEQEGMIITQSEKILDKTEELSQLQAEFNDLTLKNEEQEKRFLERSLEMTELETQYESTLQEIDERQDEIVLLDSTLKARQAEIQKQSDQIFDQNRTLRTQRRELNYQKTYTLLSIGITLLSILAGFYIWKNYRQKKKSNLELEQKNKEIEATSRELRMVNKEMEQFAYLASHDLQEPLNTITGWIQLIDPSQLDENGKMSVNLISNSTDRMRGLIRGLLEYAKLGSHIEFESIDCTKLVNEVVQNLEGVVKKKEANIEISDLPMIKGHALKLGMLFQNLVSNALKFTKPEVTPNIRIWAVSSGDDYWEFVVEDNGIGIEEDNLEKVFEIFHREHSRDKYEGTGIGLAHVRKIVEMHEGNIWVDSQIGEGTAFHFTLLKDK